MRKPHIWCTFTKLNNYLGIFKPQIKTNSEIKVSPWSVPTSCVSTIDLSVPNGLLALSAQLTMPSLTLMLPILHSTDGTRWDKPLFCTMRTTAKFRTNAEKESNLKLN